MITYYFFYIEFLMLSYGLFVGLTAIRKKDVERALTMLIVVLMAWIGLACDLDQWYRVFVAIHDIPVESWG